LACLRSCSVRDGEQQPLLSDFQQAGSSGGYGSNAVGTPVEGESLVRVPKKVATTINVEAKVWFANERSESSVPPPPLFSSYHHRASLAGSVDCTWTRQNYGTRRRNHRLTSCLLLRSSLSLPFPLSLARLPQHLHSPRHSRRHVVFCFETSRPSDSLPRRILRPYVRLALPPLPSSPRTSTLLLTDSTLPIWSNLVM
jgi:hypothetical protein